MCLHLIGVIIHFCDSNLLLVRYLSCIFDVLTFISLEVSRDSNNLFIPFSILIPHKYDDPGVSKMCIVQHNIFTGINLQFKVMIYVYFLVVFFAFQLLKCICSLMHFLYDLRSICLFTTIS